MKQRLGIVVGCLILLVILFIIGNEQKKSFSIRFPGEFERQQAVWLQWPSEVYEGGPRPVSPVTIRLIQALAPYIRVNLMVRNQLEIELIKGLLEAGGFSGSAIHYYIVSHLSIWARDVGPIFIRDRRNHLQVVDFGFNNYSRDGDPNYIDIESRVDKRVAKLLGLPAVTSSLISEGGAIESNGRGCLMVTASVALKRNPGLSRMQIAKEYQRVLGSRKIIWLNKGLAEDDAITSGHINEIARFADPRTILLARVPAEDRDANPVARSSYRRLEENCRILRNATDQDGQPFRIIRIPMPVTLYSEAKPNGEFPVRSYLNFFITNGAVLLPVYWRPGRSPALKTMEEQVKSIFRRTFPGRRIIGIDVENVNLWGGGIHCITQPMPAS
ncbi:MAG TPA: agmatine deiminase family protein [Bacillota bacterium]